MKWEAEIDQNDGDLQRLCRNESMRSKAREESPCFARNVHIPACGFSVLGSTMVSTLDRKAGHSDAHSSQLKCKLKTWYIIAILKVYKRYF